MQRLLLSLKRGIACVLLLTCLVKISNGQAQTLKLSDFAIWGGSASPTSYNNSQGVFLKEKAKITGNIGSNHLVDAKENFTLTGNIFSGNGVFLKTSTIITGNITANKTAANFTGNVISGNIKSDFKGNLTAKGKIVIVKATGSSASFVRGKVAVPAPSSTNYSGPTPIGGITNTFTLPVLPTMPANTAFDNQVGTATITGTQTITPGKYKKLALTGGKTLTFDGPGNYIFYNIDNGNTNKFVFDFKNTTTGTINIFVIKDARLGKLSVSTKNGNFPSRIYTEVHGDGSGCDGFAIELQSPDVMPSSNYVWLGNIWAPNSGINVKSLLVSNTTPHIIGALWSAKQVDIKANLNLSYQAPAVGTGPSFIAPYYAPPTTGKVTTANNVIGAELVSLSQNPAPITSIPNNEIFVLDNAGKVMIEVISKAASDATLRSQLVTLGMTGIVDNGPHVYVITGFFPISNLSQLNSNTRIDYVRPLYPPISNAGQVTTQGDTTMRSHNVRGRFGLDGTGVKVGVISDSYNSKLVAQNDVDQGDLPGVKTNGTPNDNPNPVQLVADLSRGGADEGRAMLQIVHDVAPKARLAFRTGFLTAGDFAKGIQELASPTLPGGRCDVIVDDITYITEPFLRDGVVAQTVDQVAAQGVTYFSSAGNFGKQSYESVFTGVTNTSVIATGQIHRYGATAADIYQSVNLKPGSYTIVLQWSDEFSSLGSATGVQTDMDLYLLGANGFTLFGFNRSNLFGDPFEVCPFTVEQETNAKIMVVRAAGTSNVRFKYIIFRGDATILDYQTGNSSIVGHPNANGAIAVGAMLYANIPQFTPVWPGVASFSSRGGTSTLTNNVFSTRNKPELIGPNGTNTTVNLGGAAFNDGDPYPNFFGTSAAAPHAAAVGALLIQGRKKFNLQTTVTPAEIRQQLISSAGKFSYLPGNFSFEGGYGYVQADSAVQQIANAKPIADTLIAVTPGGQNGSLPFQVKIKGKYLTSTTQIYVGGAPVTTTVSTDKTEATATVPAIAPGGNPAFQLSNSAKSPSQLDGGLSEGLFFFGSRIPVTVTAQSFSRKYGVDNPIFTAQVLINGVPIGQTNVTLASLKLDGANLAFETIATRTSNAGLYGIFPSRAVPLALNDPLLSQYSFTFVSGTLTVQKMSLTITPVNKTVKYGEDPGEITYNYQFGSAVPPASPLFGEVRDLHKQYLADNALVAINGFSNSTSDLTNMSAMASFQALRNARKFVLQNGQLQLLATTIDTSLLGAQRFIVDLSGQSLANYIANPTAPTNMIEPTLIPRGRGLINLKTLTNGTATAAVPNGQLKAIVNGQLLAMVNGQLKALVNGQLKALVNGQLMPLANGKLVAMVNGQLKALVNGQLLALVNGQLMTPDDDNNLQIVEDLSISNGQLKALVNGQLKALVNGQLKAIVNGIFTDISFVNGQLKALVNGVPNTDLTYVNGQLKAIVNGQLKAIVNGAEVGIDGARQLANGQAQVLIDGNYIPIANGQLKALVNTTADPNKSQLLSMVNGQLMAIVNNELTFVVFQNGQLKALVNGELQDQPLLFTNGQLKAIVNGQLQTTNASIVNGQLKAIVNGEDWIYSNGQLKALVNNGQFQPLINNFDVTGANNNTRTVVLVDEDDINLQSGDIGGMFSVNMITGLNSGIQKLVPGAFVNENFEVTYGLGDITILPVLHVNGDNKTKFEGESNPPLSLSYDGFLNGDNENTICAGTASYIVPASPVSIKQLARVTNYTDIRLNNGTNVITVSPGATVTLTGNRNSYSEAVVFEDCIGCVTQHYFGIKDIFSVGFDANGSSGAINNTFRAPTTPGVYYVTQVSSWQYNIFDDGAGVPDNDPANAIAVVIVDGVYKPYAVTPASSGSLIGNYPITMGGCTDFANYGLVYTPGTLSVVADPCLTLHWDGNINYTDRKSGVAATPTGGVSFLGLGRVGGIGTFDGLSYRNQSLAFDGTGYLDAGTAGSVAGDGDFSVSAWVQTTSNMPMVVINQRGADVVNFGDGFYGEYYLKIGGNQYDVAQNGNAGKAYFFMYDEFNNIAEVGVFSTTLVNDGNWHHIKGERTGTTIRIYVDGVLEGTASTAGTVILDSAIPTYIGADFRDQAAYFNGLIDDIRVSMCAGTSFRSGSTTNSRSVTPSTAKVATSSTTEAIARETKLYPNPSSTTIRLQLETDVKSVNDFQVIDVIGKANRIVAKKLNEGVYELDISRLGRGVYFIKANTTTGIKTFRFIKM